MKKSFRILAADSISKKGIQLIQETEAFTIVTRSGLSEEELIELIPEFDAVIVRSATKITSKAIKAAPQLKVIGRAGVGVDNVDVEAATERGIVVMNTPGGNTISTAEHTLSLMMASARCIPQAHASMREGKWDRKKFEGVELFDKTLGILGMGRIGREVARRAISFGMRVLAYDPYLAMSQAKSLQVELVDSLEELLPRADFLTLHLPLTQETSGLLNQKQLSLCKKGMRIVNCARGGLIVDEDLIVALDSGQIGGAALDVFAHEPLAEDHPYRSHPQVLLTPHLAASTGEAQENVGIEIAEAILSFLKEGSIRNAVNMPNVDAATLAVLRPYLSLGYQLGKILSQLAPKRLDSLVVRYSGKARDLDTAPITRAILKGLLAVASGDNINEVNAPKVARNHGLSFSETKVSESCDFAELISVEAISEKETHEVSATFFGNRAKIVSIDHFEVEADPKGVLFVMENLDRPGIVGWLGTFLGQKNINIASMSLARTQPGNRALSVLNLDELPSDAIVQELMSQKDIYSIKLVKL